jgi:hypothetical protein
MDYMMINDQHRQKAFPSKAHIHVLLHVQRVGHKFYVIYIGTIGAAVQFLKYLVVFIFLIVVFIVDCCLHLYIL